MSQDKFWILLSKKFSQEATAEELAELQELVRAHPEWQYAIQNLEDLWSLKPVKNLNEQEEAYLHHMQRMKERGTFPATTALVALREIKRNRFRPAGKLVWAASVIGIIVTAFLLFNKEKNAAGMKVQEETVMDKPQASPENSQSEISTQPGSKSIVHLPDGSTVWLNAGSRLVYQKDFGQKLREVELRGEGFFDVAKNKEKPFIIHTKTIDIKVLGTAFNVKAYPEDKTTETSLIRGSIEVLVKDRPNDKYYLSPNEKLVVKTIPDTVSLVTQYRQPVKPEIVVSQLVVDTKDSSVAETQWVKNRLVFRNEPLSEIATKLERWYNVSIIIRDPELEQLRLYGTFEDESVEQALSGLAYTKGFHYDVKGKEIIIHK